MIVPGLTGHISVHQPAGGLEIEHEDLCLQKRGLDPLSFASPLPFQKRQHDALTGQRLLVAQLVSLEQQYSVAFGMQAVEQPQSGDAAANYGHIYRGSVVVSGFAHVAPSLASRRLRGKRAEVLTAAPAAAHACVMFSLPLPAWRALYAISLVVAYPWARINLRLRARREPDYALRTSERQAELRRTNSNAAAGVSSHEFGATVDLSYAAFAPPQTPPVDIPNDVPDDFHPHLERLTDLALESLSARKSRELGRIFSEVLAEAQDEGLALVIYERQQTVYHVTARERDGSRSSTDTGSQP